MNFFAIKIEKKKWVISFLLVLTVNWYVLSSVAYAATSLVEIELFTNQNSSNNSASTYQSPIVFNANESSKAVEFSVSGQALANVNLLTGRKQAVLVIPEELIGKVKSNGKARIEVDVLLSENAPVIGGLLGTVSKLLKDILAVIGLLVPVAGKISSLLNRLFNLGKITYAADIIDHGSYLSINYTDGLATAIIQNLNGVVAELRTILQDLSSNPLVRLLLGQLTTAVNNLSQALANPSAELLDSLANASILSNTKVTFPTLINNPGAELYGDSQGVSTQDFYMHIVQTAVIDVNLFKGSSSLSKIYLKALKAEKTTNLGIPVSLNFGQHTIQTLKDEKWIATDTGQQTEQPVMGNVLLMDTTAGSKSWEIKVRQLTDWKNNQEFLSNPVLKLYRSELEYIGFKAEEISYPFLAKDDYIELTTGNEQKLVGVNSVNSRGQIEFNISKFELFVPKNQKKNEGVYQTEFIWTASNSP